MDPQVAEDLEIKMQRQGQEAIAKMARFQAHDTTSYQMLLK